MNYNEFIKAVDEKLACMPESEKGKWIHNLARTIQEDERCKFFNSLNGGHNNGEIIHNIEEIQEWCKKIQNGDIYFECSYCEVYSENYWRDDSYDYYDTYEIGKKLTSAFQVAEDLLYQKEYEKASVLYNLLIDMVFQAYDSDSEETLELGIEELVDEDLVSLNLKKIVLNLLYAKYQTSNGKERVQAIYNYIKLNISKDINLEEFFTIGPEELVGIAVFLEEWIIFLKREDGDLAGNLLFEACMLQGGIEMLCATAREMVQKHPVLYLRACKYLTDESKDTECEKIGLEAIGLLNEELIIRGKVADLTAKAAKELEHANVVWKCYKAGEKLIEDLKYRLNYSNDDDKSFVERFFI